MSFRLVGEKYAIFFNNKNKQKKTAMVGKKYLRYVGRKVEKFV